LEFEDVAFGVDGAGEGQQGGAGPGQ
jgi:hypothetical protein